ncbi:MAG: ornithine carbamoyltransferase [Planctomycetota bacterium]|nr:MAG: ornithine carbamoyltransferase [Planctomycetota bacterium]
MADWNHKDLVSLEELKAEEIGQILDLADSVKAKPKDFKKALKRRVLAMIFQKPSTRTRVSFETGIYQLGGIGMYLGANDMQLGRGETIADTAKVLSRYVDLIMARVFAHDDIVQLAKHATVPVINGLSDYNHPCQILADLQTIREHKGKLEGLRLVYIGDGNNVAHSLLFGCAKMGMHVVVVHAEGFAPLPAVVEKATGFANESEGSVAVSTSIEAVEAADIVYTDVWASMGQEAEHEERLKLFKSYQVNSDLMKRAKPDAIFMHCLPAHRGEEVTDEVVDSPQSVVLDEAENRLHAQKAVMILVSSVK